MPKYIIDLHVHPTLKPAHRNTHTSLWNFLPSNPYCKKEQLPTFFKSVPEGLDTFSQTNLDKCKAGNVRAVFIALYPPEKSLYNLRWFTDILVADEKEINLGTCVSGFDRSFIAQYIKEVKSKESIPINYFEELEKEYAYTLGQENETNQNGKFKIATDYDQFIKIIEEEPDTFLGIITIEGLHALGEFPSYKSMEISSKLLNNRDSAEFKTYYELYRKNIAIVKSWGNDGNHAPFFITFCHHFWNLMCGQARSFSGVSRTFGYNQNFGINEGMTQLGREVLKLLLDKTNGRRILIDTKHMSVNSRRDFYAIWEEYKALGDDFPIISSHTCVNGIKTLDDCANKRDNSIENTNKYFNNWSINLCDEDIQYVYRSKGLIGVFLHEPRILGGILKDRIEELKRLKQYDLLRDECLKIIMANIFHIVQVCNTKEAWDIVCMGTDNDGLIKTLTAYEDGATKMPELAQNMLQFLYRPMDIPEAGLKKEDFKKLLFGYTPEEAVDKIMYRNIENFLKIYFNDGYLRENKTPPVIS